MSKHTKGPFKVALTFIENTPTRYGVYAKRVAGGPLNGELVALCEKEENANLFSAAPELLEALKLCVQRMEELQEVTNYPLAWPRVVAEEAIAKAEGGT